MNETKRTQFLTQLLGCAHTKAQISVGAYAGEESSASARFLRGCLLYIGPDSMKDRAKINKLLKSVQSGQSAPESALSKLLIGLSVDGVGGVSDEGDELAATKRSTTISRIRKSRADFEKLARGVRQLLVANMFPVSAEDPIPDYTTLDRWVKLCDYILKLAERHSWPVASSYMVEFLQEHDFELIAPESSHVQHYTCVWPEMLDDVLAANPAPRPQPRQPPLDQQPDRSRVDRQAEQALYDLFNGACMICMDKNHKSGDCDKRKNLTDRRKCPSCGIKKPCPKGGLVWCAADIHGIAPTP
jgi:hypothetical protein